MKANINLPKNAIYMIHAAPNSDTAGCVLVHFDRYGVPRALMSGFKMGFLVYPSEAWIDNVHHCHMVASHEPDVTKITKRRIKQIVKHWKRNADICNNAEKQSDLMPVMSWYGGFVLSPQNK